VVQIDVVARSGTASGRPESLGRRPVFETDDLRIGETRVAPGVTSAWHHHGRRTLYGYVVTGQLVLEFGPGGAESVRPSAGEFFRIPAGLVHRDVNRGTVEAFVVSVSSGGGPVTIDVAGPDG
jgi:quercetin dioxygenase-like cupin family protein